MSSLDIFTQCFERRPFAPQLEPADRHRIELHGRAPDRGAPSTALPPPGESWDPARLEFDPAMKHFINGWRSGEPELDEDQRGPWRRAHGMFMGHVLERIAASELSDQLVLRGSSAMPFWVGEQAREPKDIDFVVVPHEVDIQSAAAHRLREGLCDTVEREPPSGITVLTDATAISDIWTYDRVPGQRLSFTWRAGDLPWAQTQIDMVYGERLPEAPRHLEDLGLLIAGPELSLAWKLLWLYNDMHPQAKDLYDAMVLAERHSLSTELLREVFGEVLAEERSVDLTRMVDPEMEWVGLQPRSPWAESSRRLAESWWDRLLDAAPRVGDPTPL